MPNDVLVKGGARLRAVRKERGYTQERLAELTKLSTRHVAGIEKGEANPSFEVLYTIITALGTSFDAIFNPADEQMEREVQEVAGLYRACPEQGRRLCVYASGSLMTVIFCCCASISVSCLHLGQCGCLALPYRHGSKTTSFPSDFRIMVTFSPS